jgi:hypothetical protein
MAYRDDARSKSTAARVFHYRPKARARWRIVVDLAVIGFALWFVLHTAWRRDLRCAWEGHLASCTTTTENALGKIESQSFGGIRSAAFQTGPTVGFVTDMVNRDPDASFGTRVVTVDTDQEAADLRAFADDRVPKSVAYFSGVKHPLYVTLAAMLGLFVFAFLTRTATLRVTVDANEGLLILRRGPFDVERFELAKVKGFEVENAEAGLHRVWLRTPGGDRALSKGFLPGEHHHTFVAAVNGALHDVKSPRVA